MTLAAPVVECDLEGGVSTRTVGAYHALLHLRVAATNLRAHAEDAAPDLNVCLRSVGILQVERVLEGAQSVRLPAAAFAKAGSVGVGRQLE